MSTNSSTIDALHFDGQSLDLEKDGLHTLQEEGGLILKQATNLQALESVLLENLWSAASITSEIVTNKVRHGNSDGTLPLMYFSLSSLCSSLPKTMISSSQHISQ